MTKRIYLFLWLCIIFHVTDLSGQSVKIEGKVRDITDGAAIINCVISVNPGNIVSVSDRNGTYTFICPAGIKEINTRVLGYRSEKIQFLADHDTIIDINLVPLPVEIGEVSVNADSLRNISVTREGSYIIDPAAGKELPVIFSEPDLMKTIQLIPGILPGKDGSSDVYVRGGSRGQNVFLANGCSFFLPAHMLGFVSSIDLDFLQNAEIYKDYLPSGLGGGASSVISLDYKEVSADSLKASLRLGLMSSGVSIQLPLKKPGWNISAGIKRGNYSLYAPLLRKIVNDDIAENLPPDGYSFFDSFLKLTHSSDRWGDITYLFLGNFDYGKEEYITNSYSGDTLTIYTDAMRSGWNNMVHALQWYLPAGNNKWRLDLNYNRISMQRRLNSTSERYLSTGEIFELNEITYSLLPKIENIGISIVTGSESEKFSYDAGFSTRVRFFSPGISSAFNLNDTTISNETGTNKTIIEPVIYFSSKWLLNKVQIDAGIRLTGIISGEDHFFVPEPRLRISFNTEGRLSPHITLVRLSQSDHSLEGSNAGMRTMFWIPVSHDFGPEISDILSGGFQGITGNTYRFTADVYYKKISGMVDYRPGSSFIFDTSLEDLLYSIEGRAYGIETGVIKQKGNLTGSASYTYSRSKIEWSSPDGLIWIPSLADRPHDITINLNYKLNKRFGFGANWIYVSGSPATIYMHDTSYGEWFETKNNIRYFDYHRLDLSCRYRIIKRKYSLTLNADIYNVYNRKNTFYFKKIYNEQDQIYYFKNVSLFPVMPTVSILIEI